MNERPDWDKIPGSSEARRAGCKCPVVENNQGKGIDEGNRIVWVLNKSCLLHQDLTRDSQAYFSLYIRYRKKESKR